MDTVLASLIQHTSETKATLMEYTLPELEGLSQALNENNNMDDNDTDSFVDSNSLTGADAIKGLLASGYAT